jgi:hypothetical protein
MATNIISVSVPLDLAQFLEENPDLSPSKIVQQKLYEIKNDSARMNERLKAYEIRNGRIAAKLNKLLLWCEENNVIIPENVLE